MINVGHTVRYSGMNRGTLYNGSQCRVLDINGDSAAILHNETTYCVEVAHLREEGNMKFEEFQILCSLIKSGQKIEAIKLIRKIYGLGLKDSKDLLDMLTNYKPAY